MTMFSNSQNLRLYVKNIKLEARHATDMDYIHIMRSSDMSYIYHFGGMHTTLHPTEWKPNYNRDPNIYSTLYLILLKGIQSILYVMNEI